MVQFTRGEIVVRDEGQPLTLARGHRFKGRTEPSRALSLDLDKRDGRAIPRDEVYLPARATIVSREYPVALPAEKPFSQSLSFFTEPPAAHR